MKYPQRGQTSLQCRDSRRDEQTGQNWTVNSTEGTFGVSGSGWLILSQYRSAAAERRFRLKARAHDSYALCS